MGFVLAADLLTVVINRKGRAGDATEPGGIHHGQFTHGGIHGDHFLGCDRALEKGRIFRDVLEAKRNAQFAERSEDERMVENEACRCRWRGVSILLAMFFVIAVPLVLGGQSLPRSCGCDGGPGTDEKFSSLHRHGAHFATNEGL